MTAEALTRHASAGSHAGLAAPLCDRQFALALRFNLLPGDYADPGWLQHLDAALTPDVLERMPASAFWTKRLSRRLLAAWELDRMYDFDFADHGKRLALLDPAALLAASRVVAAVLVRDPLRTIVHGPTVARLRETLGANAHRVALAWNTPTPDMPSVFTDFSAETLETEQWARHTMALALEAIPPSATGVTARMRLKFPRFDAPSPLAGRFDRQLTEARRRGLAAVFTAVIRQQLPSWGWLFDPA